MNIRINLLIRYGYFLLLFKVVLCILFGKMLQNTQLHMNITVHYMKQLKYCVFKCVYMKKM